MKSQVSVEFMFMIMAASIMVVIFAFVFSDMYQENLKEKQRILFSDFGRSIQKEILIASDTRPGYERNFEIPDDLEGYDYDILLYANTLIINSTYASYAFAVPRTNGALQKGENNIKNLNNTICLNC